MELIIKIPDEDYKFIKDLESLIIGGRGSCKTIQQNVINAIKTGTPYNPSGDCISRSALKETLKENEWITDDPFADGGVLEEIIDNALPVEPHRPQGAWKFNERGSFYCSVCNGEPYDQYGTTAFCPFCGADLRKGDAE